MKISVYLALLTATLASAHMSMKNPLPRGHPLNPNAATKDFACIIAPLNGGVGCAPKPFPCGGYPVDTKITQVVTAGEVIDVAFWNPNFPNGPSSADATANQGRHNGGQCEFSLSYDGGKTYTVIGTYHKTCPDIFFGWKVKIPENAPSCNNPGKCLFSWSWINAVGNREFYQNCADVRIQGNSTTPLPIKDITRANLAPGFPNLVTPDGDPANTGNAKGSGPQSADVSANLGPFTGGSINNKINNTTPNPGKPISHKKSHKNKKVSKPIASGDSNSIANTPAASSPTLNNSPPDATIPSSPSTTDTNGSCSINGEMKCVNDGSFTTCANGVLVTRQCPLGTVCIQNGEWINCGYPKRKF